MPSDIPDGVLGQLGNKVQHALRAYTPKEQKAAKAVAESFRENKAFDTFDTLLELGVGEALVSVLDAKGVPTVVEKATILPPQSQMGALDDNRRKDLITGNMLYSRYTQVIDRESAYELLAKKAESDKQLEAQQKQLAENEKLAAKQAKEQEKLAAKQAKEQEKAVLKAQNARKKEVKKVVNSATGTIGREIGKTIGKSLGGSFGKTLGGNVGASLARGIFNTLLK